MITDPELINSIYNRKLKVINMGFEPTRRCNLACGHCYVDDAQAVDLDKRVAQTVLDSFPVISTINLYGGESPTSTQGIACLGDALKEKKTKFNRMGLAANMTVYNKDFFEELKRIESMAQDTGDWKIGIMMSNDEWHDESMNKAGIRKKDAEENYERAKKEYPSFFIKKARYKTKDECCLQPVGRAKKHCDNSIKVIRHDLVLTKRATPEEMDTLYYFRTDAKGNAIQNWRTYKEGEIINYGNVLKTPSEEILIINGRESTV